jgi:hypothetical protein
MRPLNAAVMLAALALSVAVLPGGPARAEGEVCRNGSQSYQPDQTLCLDNVLYTCQDNGAWQSDRRRGCVDPVTTSNTMKSCPVGPNRTAANGVRRCIQGQQKECSDGAWVELGPSC